MISDRIQRRTYIRRLTSGRLDTVASGAEGLARIGARDVLRAELDNPDPVVREAAAGALARIAEPEDLSRFVTLLSDTKLGIPEIAQSALRDAGVAAVPLVVDLIAADPANAPFEAVELLGDLAAPESVSVLRAVIEAGRVRDEAMRSLAGIATDEARHVVEHVADTSADRDEAEYAARLLARWGVRPE